MKRLMATEDVPAFVSSLVSSIENPGMLAGYWYDRCVGAAKDPRQGTLLTVGDDAMAVVTSSAAGYDVLELIVVGKNARGAGVGSRLMATIIGMNNDRPLFLEVHVDNSRAISLYRRLGFRMSGVHGNYIGMRMSPHVRAKKR